MVDITPLELVLLRLRQVPSKLSMCSRSPGNHALHCKSGKHGRL